MIRCERSTCFGQQRIVDVIGVPTVNDLDADDDAWVDSPRVLDDLLTNSCRQRQMMQVLITRSMMNQRTVVMNRWRVETKVFVNRFHRARRTSSREHNMFASLRHFTNGIRHFVRQLLVASQQRAIDINRHHIDAG